MSSEKYEREDCESFIITYDNLRSIPSNNSLAEGQSLFNFGPNNDSFSFTININPPNGYPKKIRIKNVIASLSSASGYLYKISCPTLFKGFIPFADSEAGSIDYVEYKYNPLGLTHKITIERKSGDLPMLAQADYLINPGFAFTLYYYYW